MFMTIESARLTCWTTFSIFPFSIWVSSSSSSRFLPSRATGLRASPNSSTNSWESAEKLLTKFSGFLISCAMPAVSCPSEASFCVWTRRSWAVRNSSSESESSLVRSCTCSNIRTLPMAITAVRLDLIEQSDIFDRDRCLVGKSRDQFDLLLGKRTRLRARQGDYADRNALAQHRNGEHSAETTQSLRFGKGVVGVCLNVGNVNHGPFQQSPPNSRASIRHNGNGSDKGHEFVRKPVRLGTKKHAVYLAGNGG